MKREFDCVVCGETCVDLTVCPVDRSIPLNVQGMQLVESIQPGTGGIVPNSGLAMVRMGMTCAGFGCVGDDHWASLLIDRLSIAGMNTEHIERVAGKSTSVTAILVDETGEHNFLFYPGASAEFDADLIRRRFSLFERAEFAHFGYYGLFDQVAAELPALLQQIQQRGCRTALDATAGGGTMQPLDRILPHLDLYVPSYEEAKSQTGCEDPQKMIRTFREFAPQTILGVKLGADGALLSPAADKWIEVAAITPPGAVIDTTGAGDCFYAGLICGLVRGMSIADAGKLAAAAGACSVTRAGATAGLPDFETLRMLAGIS
jgi:sugar/nucleoside kinase (ribokinase family)